MNDSGRRRGAEGLAEMCEMDVARLLRIHGWDAFLKCDDVALTVEGVGAVDDQQFDVALLRFVGGVLKLTRGKLSEVHPTRYFLSVDFHDYREAVLDQRIVEDAYRRFAHFAQRHAECGGGFDGLHMQCCPDQGTAFAAIESEDRIADSKPLSDFLISYFESGAVTCDLHRAFGEATIAFAKATVPSLVASIAR